MKASSELRLVIAVALGAGLFAAEPPVTVGEVTDVTVYQGQALVTRTVEAELAAGISALVVKELPPKVLPESLHARSLSGPQVLSVRYRETAVRQDARSEVANLENKIQTVDRSLRQAQQRLEHFNQQWQMFENLKNFTVTGTRSDLNHGLLTSAQSISDLTALIERKGSEYLEQRMELDEEIQRLQEERSLLERQRRNLMADPSQSEREAVVFLRGDAGGEVVITLSYLVNDANWSQQYNLRANPDQSTVVIEYNAVINQTSGEDWSNVNLQLSTADPSMVAAAPTLEPMQIRTTSSPGPQLSPAMPGQSQVPTQQLREQQRARFENMRKGITANFDLNSLAVSNQGFFLQASGLQAAQAQRELAESGRAEGVSATYQLPEKLSVPSRSDQQLVSLAVITSPAQFTFLATPLLTDYVYLEAALTNNSETVLLPGSAAMFRNGQFVGRGQLPLVTMGEAFTAGFGIDSQLQVDHRLENKTTRIQGGNRIDTYDYRIMLSNYKNSSVDLKLLDRLPFTEDSTIRIELVEATPALSQHSEYQRDLRKKGILRWDVSLKPSTVGEAATIVKYRYSVEYDRSLQIEPARSSQ